MAASHNCSADISTRSGCLSLRCRILQADMFETPSSSTCCERIQSFRKNSGGFAGFCLPLLRGGPWFPVFRWWARAAGRCSTRPLINKLFLNTTLSKKANKTLNLKLKWRIFYLKLLLLDSSVDGWQISSKWTKSVLYIWPIVRLIYYDKATNSFSVERILFQALSFCSTINCNLKARLVKHMV